ncbi:hypothetical protein NDU88_006516 [Pleurodeles waltl]|uniref:Uncharacterized protein n=1 Tax=Pleurodeles waltl TaxID=8319 RepID=A0AAV7PL86_PLEWA|nr:hypothetical protein NDU88_006516 [Pleurodeles waltl]
MPESQGQPSCPNAAQHGTRPRRGSQEQGHHTDAPKDVLQCPGPNLAAGQPQVPYLPGRHRSTERSDSTAPPAPPSSQPANQPTAATVGPGGQLTHWPVPASSPPDRNPCRYGRELQRHGLSKVGSGRGRAASASRASTKIQAAPALQQRGGHQAQSCLNTPRRRSHKGIHGAPGLPGAHDAPSHLGEPQPAAGPGKSNGRIISPDRQSLTE